MYLPTNFIFFFTEFPPKLCTFHRMFTDLVRVTGVQDEELQALEPVPACDLEGLGPQDVGSGELECPRGAISAAVDPGRYLCIRLKFRVIMQAICALF